MKRFFESLYIFIRLYMMGYSWSGLFDRHEGFYRLNYIKNGKVEYALIDIDFNTQNPHPYSHIHGGKDNWTLFRVDIDQITEHSKDDIYLCE